MYENNICVSCELELLVFDFSIASHLGIMSCLNDQNQYFKQLLILPSLTLTKK